MTTDRAELARTALGPANLSDVWERHVPKHWLLVVLYLRWVAEVWPAEVTSADRIRQAMGTGAP